MRLTFSSLVIALTCTTPHAARPEMTTPAYTPPPVESYRFISDQVMGGVSTGEVGVAGPDEARYLHLRGNVSTANQGGFIQARVRLPAPLPAGARGVIIRVRGNGTRYFVHLRTRGTVLPWQYYQAAFETTGDWQELRLPFTAFAPSGALLRATPRPETVTSFAAVAFGRDHAADLQLQWLGVY